MEHGIFLLIVKINIPVLYQLMMDISWVCKIRFSVIAKHVGKRLWLHYHRWRVNFKHLKIKWKQRMTMLMSWNLLWPSIKIRIKYWRPKFRWSNQQLKYKKIYREVRCQKFEQSQFQDLQPQQQEHHWMFFKDSTN